MRVNIDIITFAALFCFTSVFSDSIPYWNGNVNYEKNKNIVFFQGVRYFPTNDNFDKSPDMFEEGEYWERLISSAPTENNLTRVLPQAHHNIRDILVKIDGFVSAVEQICGFDILGKINSVALFREKPFVGEYLHSTWTNFMVGSAGWEEIYDSLKLERIKKDIDIKGDVDSDDFRERYHEIIRRPQNISREYNNYKQRWSSEYKGIFGILTPTIISSVVTGSFLTLTPVITPVVLPVVYKDRTSAYEQMVHNIGDAGVAFGHALNDLSNTSEKAKNSLFPNERGNDIREAGNEYAIRKAINRQNERQDIVKNYLTGSIYDAIAEYGIRTIEAVNWAKQNIKATGKCNTGKEIANNDECFENNESNFNTLVYGKGNPIWGVTSSAIAVGRAILIDAMLAEKPLEHGRIFGPSFLDSNNPDSSYIFTAYARDPDAVVIVHKDSLGSLSENAKRLVYNVKDEYNNENINYELWHEPSVHNMYYEWLIGDSIVFRNSENEVLNKNVKEKMSLYTKLIDSISVKAGYLSKIPDTTSEDYELLSKEIDALAIECKSLLSEYYSLRSKYAATVNSEEIYFKVILPQGLTSDSLKKGIDATIKLQFFDNEDKHYDVKLKNSSFDFTARITDDEGDAIIVKKRLTFLDRLPVVAADIKKSGSSSIYLVKVKHKNTSFTDFPNGVQEISGFSDPNCYNPIYFDAFGTSIDPDGNASDQITKSVYYFDNDSIVIRGVNQNYTVVTGGNVVNGEEKEERTIINNLLYLQTEEDYKIKAYSEEHFVSSKWENDSSPTIKTDTIKNIIQGEKYEFHVKIYDNEGSSQISSFTIPVLVPPVIDTVQLAIRVRSDTTKNIKEYKNETITLKGENEILRFYAKAFDPDNEENSKENVTYSWGIRESGENSDIVFLPSSFSKPLETVTYQELQGLLGFNLIINPGIVYDVFVKVKDDDSAVTGNKDVYGFAVRNIGAFKYEL
ncbi:MAG: hypothetical protein LBH98_03270 [Chitinispirillales bacterium]|jgi:hypothetical protein|nr:hypothetical protein [Chitinispirillales bacterium]